MVCIIPYYIAILIVFFHPNPIEVFLLIRVLFATRILRIFRIFVIMKHFLALKILMFTIRASTRELFLLLIVLLIGVVTFACIEYYMEIFSNEPTDFHHIPLAFWWALITMTTVGYGDVVPKSGLGYAIGGFCAISGVLVIALSVPVIVNNFTVYYTHAQSREKLKLRKKKFEQTEKWQRLKAGLKSKLKNGTLNGILNAARKKPAMDNGKQSAVPKSRTGITGGGASAAPQRAAHDIIDMTSCNGGTHITPIKIEEHERSKSTSVPLTARDIELEDSETMHTETETSLTDDTISIIGAGSSKQGSTDKLITGSSDKGNVAKKRPIRSKVFSRFGRGSPKVGVKPLTKLKNRSISNGTVGFGRRTERFKEFPVT